MDDNYVILNIPGLINAPLFKLYENDVLVRELYIVLNKTTEFLACYDKVSDKIYEDYKGRTYTVYGYCKEVLKHSRCFTSYVSLNPITNAWDSVSEDDYIISMISRYLPGLSISACGAPTNTYIPVSYIESNITSRYKL